MESIARMAVGIIALMVGTALGLAILWRLAPNVAGPLTGGALVLAGVMATSIASGIRLSLHEREMSHRSPQPMNTFNLPAGQADTRLLTGPAPYADVTEILDGSRSTGTYRG